MSKPFAVNINPYNHFTYIGRIDRKPEIVGHKNKDYFTFIVHVQVPRDFLSRDYTTRKPCRKFDGLKGSCYITSKQADMYRDKFKVGKWVTLRGEIRSASYVNKNGTHIIAHPCNLEDIELYQIPNTDTFMISPYDRDHIINGIKNFNWMISRPGLIRKFAPDTYKWLMAHDAFVPTEVNDFNKIK